MTKYVLISASFSGNISCIYDSKGQLFEFLINSWDVPSDIHPKILGNFSWFATDSGIREFANRYKYVLKKETIDLSWNRFYEMYGIKRDGHKAEPKWNRMSEKDKYLTLLNLKAYKRFCKRNPLYSQMYPAAYLNGHTRDDWDKVPDFKK